MPKNGKKVAIGLGVVAGIGALIYAATKAKAAPPTPPIIYTCPYCGEEFTTEAELLAHIASQHPEQPPEVWYTCPICGAKFTTEEELLAHIELMHPPEVVYKVDVSFRREPVCASGYMDEQGNWVCTEYFSDERKAIITVANEGAPGQFTTVVGGWLYLEGVEHSPLFTQQWTSEFAVGQSQTYSKTYMIPITGMPYDSRFFVKVYDPDGILIADEVFITAL